MSRDVRQYARQTNIRLALGFVLLLFVVGDGSIYFFYGRQAAVMGLICLVAGLAPIALIALAFWVIDWVVKKNNS